MSHLKPCFLTSSIRTVLLVSLIVSLRSKATRSAAASSHNNSQLGWNRNAKKIDPFVTEGHKRVPNEWSSFRTWYCNNPASQSSFSIAPYTKADSENSYGLILFGGLLILNKHDRNYGTWFYNWLDNLWHKLSTSTAPQNRKGHVMITLCHTTVLLMGGSVMNIETTHTFEVNDLWIFSDKLGTWKQLLDFCSNTSCKRNRPVFGGSTVRAILQESSPCICKESVVVFEAKSYSSAVWELRCIKSKDTEKYSWKRFSRRAPSDVRYNFAGKLTASSVPNKSIAIIVTASAVWQYNHSTGWKAVLLKKNLMSSTTSLLSKTWYPSKSQLDLVNHTVFWQEDNKLVLFGTTLNYVIIFNFTAREWTTEKVTGTPPTYKTYAVLLVRSTIIVYAGGYEGGCRQFLWTLKPTCSDYLWEWTQVPTSAVEPQESFAQSSVVLGSHVYLRSYVPRPNPKDKTQLWDLDLESMQWWQIRGNNSPPPLRTGCMTTTKNRSHIIVTGLVNDAQSFNTWIYSPLSAMWIKVDTSTPVQFRRRQMYSFVQVNETDFLLFGGWKTQNGRKGKKLLNDLWTLKLHISKTRSSRLLQLLQNRNSTTAPKDRPIPTPRAGHSVVVINSSMIVFGGRYRSRDCLHDMWSLDIYSLNWSLIKTNNEGPRPSSQTYCYSSIVAVGPHLLVLAGCSRLFFDRNPNECARGDSQQTWLYLPHLNKWSFVTWIRNFNALHGNVLFQFRNYVIIPEMHARFRLLYLLPQCPDELVSLDIKTSACRPCPIGKFPSLSKDRCEACPQGLTTPTEGSSSIFNCSVCTSSVCINGKCLIQQKEGRPSPVCQCTAGFTGTDCSMPTFYIVAVSVLIVTILLTSATCGFLHFRKRKLQRERQLRHQVRELTSAWQVNFTELNIHNKIGSGGSGEVYKAEYRDLTVAVKFLLPIADETDSQEFEKEINFMQTIRHPNIVLFIGAGKRSDGDALPFLITEYALRGSLRNILDRPDTELSCLKRINFAIDAACGMNFLHTQQPARIHRDLKSDNLLVSSNWVVKVADFGLGRQLPKTSTLNSKQIQRTSSLAIPLLANHQRMTNRGIGTARWRCPELVQGSTDYGTAIDIYSFGIVMWEIWCRELPFSNYRFGYEVDDAVVRGERPTIVQDIPPAYARLMKLCWQQNPYLRPPFSSILEQLEEQRAECV